MKSFPKTPAITFSTTKKEMAKDRREMGEEILKASGVFRNVHKFKTKYGCVLTLLEVCLLNFIFLFEVPKVCASSSILLD